MSFLVLDPGIDSRIVDMGRPRTRSLGVPVGGAADRRSLAFGNALVGNPPDTAALEVALKGPRLRADCNVGCVLFGAPFDFFRDGARLEVGRTFTLRAGEELHIGGTRQGVRAYLCVRGGFLNRLILDSRSGQEPIGKGDVLPCESSSIRARSCPVLQAFHYRLSADAGWYNGDSYPWNIYVLPGSQATWFDENQFYSECYAVSRASNRMGLRLQGAKALTMPNREMISEPVCPGTVQVTRDGQCIILGVDGQTIGGYPKIAQVIQADLDMLGQLHPGQPIEFRKISMDEALQRNRQAAARLREWTLRLRLSLDAFSVDRTL